MDIQTPSKQKIISAITELLCEKNLSAIKVSDITERSRVSHQTFYRVFMDKYDACEYACYRLLANAVTVVGNNATVRDHTICTLTIVKTNARFFRHLLADDDGVEIVKRTLIHLSEDSISFHTEAPLTDSWVFCLKEWCKTNFATPMDEVYYRIISCYPVGQVVFGQELIDALDKYGRYTMEELSGFVSDRPGP